MWTDLINSRNNTDTDIVNTDIIHVKILCDVHLKSEIPLTHHDISLSIR